MSCKQVLFQTTTHGKWILAGEHAVVRGHPALVFPLDAQTLLFTVEACEQALTIKVDCADKNTNSMSTLVKKVIEHGMTLLSREASELTGLITIQSNISPKLGLGSSAALCVAIARWFVAMGWLESEILPQFARELEHLFHGKSSGLDIAGVNASSGVYFKQGEASPLQLAWRPHWQLTSCGEMGTTAACIAQVQSLWENQPQKAQRLDEQMSESVELARQALEAETDTSLIQLKEAIEKAQACFEAWGLITPKLSKHIQDLYAKGALAAKPTGSGAGGMVLSLWAN